jgi:hypothetical protein
MRVSRRGFQWWRFDFIQTFNPKTTRRIQEGWEKLLGHIDFAGVGELQHGLGHLASRVLQYDDRVLARRGFEDISEVSRY